MDIKNSILETIGNTPLVRINKIFQKKGVQILAKIEGANPLGSVKERIALAMIEGAEKDGTLTKGKIIVESSSGNTGIGLAMVCIVKGYKLLITMSKNVSIERRKIMRSFGVELVLVDGGSDDAWDKADQIAKSDTKKYCRVSQYFSPYNIECHYKATGREIWEQTGGKVDYFASTLGTTGTIVGAGRFLKEKNPRIKVISVEPTPKNEQQGIRNVHIQRVPQIWDPTIADENIVVEDKDAFAIARRLATEEGIFAGISSGTALWAAMQIGNKISKGVIVVIFPDSGVKYLSTKLFDCKGDPTVEA